MVAPFRTFSEKSWSDIFTGKKGESEAPKEEAKVEQEQETKAEEPIKQEAPKEEATPTVDTTSKEDIMAAAKAKMAEYVKQIDQLKAQVNKNDLVTKENLNKIKELQARVKAEMDEQENIRERGRKDVSDMKKFGVGSFCKNLLEGVDTLEMALGAARKTLVNGPNEDLSRFVDGVVMTQNMFAKILADQGISKYESLGLIADPNLHFVTAQLPDPSKEPGTISFVIKEGYMIHDRVLRPAQVCIVSPRD